MVRKTSLAKTLDISDITKSRSVLVIGDIHGCFDEMMLVLRKAEDFGFTVGEDVIISTGDITDRGPKIMECFDFLMKINNCYTVASNHDDRFRRYLIGNPVNMPPMAATYSQMKDRLLTKSYYDSVLGFISEMPHIIIFEGTAVVHANLDDRVGIGSQVIDTCLYGRKNPTRMIDGLSRCVFGHQVWPSHRLYEDDGLKFFMADGGCVFGGDMRGLLFHKDAKQEDPVLVSVPALENHFKIFKEKHHPVVVMPVQVFKDSHVSVVV